MFFCLFFAFCSRRLICSNIDLKKGVLGHQWCHPRVLIPRLVSMWTGVVDNDESARMNERVLNASVQQSCVGLLLPSQHTCARTQIQAHTHTHARAHTTTATTRYTKYILSPRKMFERDNRIEPKSKLSIQTCQHAPREARTPDLEVNSLTL